MNPTIKFMTPIDLTNPITKETFDAWKKTLTTTQIIDELDGHKVGDKVVVINGYGFPIYVTIFGFKGNPDPDFRPHAVVFFNWDCYWFPVEFKRVFTIEAYNKKMKKNGK